ncbi:hypothetical protein NKI82_34520, partial [Mesorhizobium sp. M0482]
MRCNEPLRRDRGSLTTWNMRPRLEGCIHTKSEKTSSSSGHQQSEPNGSLTTFLMELGLEKWPVPKVFLLAIGRGRAALDTCLRLNLDIASDRPQICDYLIHEMIAFAVGFGNPTVAIGYVKSGRNRVEKDPDLRIREAIDL